MSMTDLSKTLLTPDEGGGCTASYICARSTQEPTFPWQCEECEIAIANTESILVSVCPKTVYPRHRRGKGHVQRLIPIPDLTQILKKTSFYRSGNTTLSILTP